MELKKNLYFIAAKEFDLFENKVQEILEKNNFEIKKLAVETYHQEDFTKPENLIFSLKTPSLFGHKKIIIKIGSFSKISKKQMEIFVTALKITKNWVFIYYQNEKTVSIANSELKKIMNFFVLPKFDKIQKRIFIKKILIKKKMIVGVEIFNFWIDFLPNSLSWIMNEINKFETYFLVKKNINLNDAKKIAFIYGDEKIFNFVESIIIDDKKKMIENYLKLKNLKINPLYLISVLETYLLTIKKIIILENEGKNLKTISFILDKKIFFVNKLTKLISIIKEKNLINLIKRIRNLEHNVKITDINSNQLIEFFLIKK